MIGNPGSYEEDRNDELARAWAEIDRLRAQLAKAGRDLHAQLAYNAELNATIARVRELCDRARERSGALMLAEAVVRAALDRRP